MIIYPAYFSPSKGRKVPLNFAIDSVNVTEIKAAADRLGYDSILEHKRHPRDPFTLGRLVLDIKKDNICLRGDIQTKKELIKSIAAIIKQKRLETTPQVTKAQESSSDLKMSTEPKKKLVARRKVKGKK